MVVTRQKDDDMILVYIPTYVGMYVRKYIVRMGIDWPPQYRRKALATSKLQPEFNAFRAAVIINIDSEV
jgi:hypothetical protein